MRAGYRVDAAALHAAFSPAAQHVQQDSEAARACGVARTTLQRAVRAGRLSLTPEHQVDTSELMRAGYRVDAAALHAAFSPAAQHVQQDAAPLCSTPAAPDEAAAWQRECDRLLGQQDRILAERDQWRQQAERLQAQQQTTMEMLHGMQQQMTQMQQMLHHMQLRYDRLLEAPKPTAGTPYPAGVPYTRPQAFMPEIWQRILAYIREHGPQTAPQVQAGLGLEENLAHRMKRMATAGYLERVARGVYEVPGQE
jgi:hypothetical protein